ncbi:MAG: sulfatase-like hydrolase/transferase, partial [Segetibacter sp.]
DLKIDDNTLILFHSDNGAAGNGRVNSHGELRGYKFDEWEGGVRAPAVIKWPAAGITGGKQIEQVMGYVDVFPTFKEIAGVKSAAKNPFDGISMWPIISGKTKSIDRQFYLGHGAIIHGDWKLIKDMGIPKMQMKEGDMLFNIPPDYSEKNNLKASNPGMYNKLMAEVAPYDAIKAPKEILSKGPKKGFVAPKDWKITKEK